jgi:UDP-glucose 4-epimerase
MNILVTGGAGYIGSCLVGALRQAGHAVRVLDLRAPSGEHSADPGCDFIQGSATDRRLVAQVVQDVEAIYHLAWRFHHESRPEEERREIQENISSTLNLLEAALAAKASHFLFVSSAVVYGPTGPVQVDEEHPCHPDRTTLGGPVYGIAKLACEKVCLLYQRRVLPVTVFRLHSVFSADCLGQFGGMIEQALVGESVKVTRSAGGEYVHVSEVLRVLLLAISNPQACGQVLNLAGTHTYNDPELARYIVETARSESHIELIEDPTREMISVSIDRLRRELGYKPELGEFLTGLIRDAIDFSRQQDRD